MRRYLKLTELYKEAEAKLDELNELIDVIGKRLAKKPKGKIHVVNSGKRIQYYLRKNSEDKSGQYISKKEKEKIAIYLQKKYDEEILGLIEQEKKHIEKFIKKHIFEIERIEKVYSDNPDEIKSMIIPVAVSDEDYVREWLNTKFEPKEVAVDVPHFITVNGEHVRSKSELNIANALAHYKIPYKYECPLILSNGYTIYPDFTILDVNHRREMIWEHRGMMDDKEYAIHAVNRIHQYARTGIFIGDNLIITEETSMKPLGTDEIDMIIRHFLLHTKNEYDNILR